MAPFFRSQNARDRREIRERSHAQAKQHVMASVAGGFTPASWAWSQMSKLDRLDYEDAKRQMAQRQAAEKQAAEERQRSAQAMHLAMCAIQNRYEPAQEDIEAMNSRDYLEYVRAEVAAAQMEDADHA